MVGTLCKADCDSSGHSWAIDIHTPWHINAVKQKLQWMARSDIAKSVTMTDETDGFGCHDNKLKLTVGYTVAL